MPQGLKNSTSAFQRIMYDLLVNTPWDYCLAYINIVIIFSQTLEQHLNRLTKKDTNVLQKIQESRTLIKTTIEAIERIKSTKWGIRQKIGITAERLHAMTFNLDFITKDSPIRASLAKYADSANDIILKDTSGNDKNSLSTVQLKYGSETNVKMLGSPKYSQVNQKVAPKGMSGGKWSENIKYDGISSKPFDNEEVQKFLSNTERSFNKFRMDIGSTAVKAALTSGLVNAGISLVFSDSILTAIRNRKITQEELMTAAKTAAVHGVSGAIQEFSDITGIEATFVFRREDDQFYVDGPDDDVNASVEVLITKNEKKNIGTQYQIFDCKMVNKCIMCSLRKANEILACTSNKCISFVHTKCIGITEVKAKALDCIMWRCPQHRK
ncbi:unnamed protein product [Didymodactylos carnosus]|uniref:Uncharacterized protein n=1 Tax=Didymodactylos carnosus TaxID=1234261 RepID=A0A815MJA9_9BILA|nr:unnamed protein product [Didymodactylos carnosus]CAF4305613.1 unnamed protein product [Didymodactylos carnosus]